MIAFLKRRVTLALTLIGTACVSAPTAPVDPNVPHIIALSGGSGTAEAARTVTVGDDFFRPDTVLIAVGDTVTWTWTGTHQHTVTFTDGLHDSGVPQDTGSYVRFFGAPGTYGYFCKVHGDSGAVIVR